MPWSISISQQTFAGFNGQAISLTQHEQHDSVACDSLFGLVACDGLPPEVVVGFVIHSVLTWSSITHLNL